MAVATGFVLPAVRGAGWISISPSAQVLSGQLDRLHDVADHDVPVTVVHLGEPNQRDIEGHLKLRVERLLFELPTEPADPTLRRLDQLVDLVAQFA
ncbi:hypothetical protein [Mycobacterium kubicae]|nr:hypothetical protein [Mycobacterium kubicae]MCV7095795.1 hypothetical protein [Mycobacterium kubicae]ORV99664.1 hypothetical protein AWC13_09705 [Mycobacterium kubicae]QNI11164.1 hypothetical protein GAN18_08055 [Mycobacterium kubicae]QPI39378.1 hypothetical protein I2456_07920 [Mycobacterium kubicae]